MDNIIYCIFNLEHLDYKTSNMPNRLHNTDESTLFKNIQEQFTILSAFHQWPSVISLLNCDNVGKISYWGIDFTARTYFTTTTSLLPMFYLLFISVS